MYFSKANIWLRDLYPFFIFEPLGKDDSFGFGNEGEAYTNLEVAGWIPFLLETCELPGISKRRRSKALAVVMQLKEYGQN